MQIGPKTALLIIDVQKGFGDPKWGPRNNPQAEDNMGRLLRAWRRTARPVVHVQHASGNEKSPLHPGNPGFEPMDVVAPEGDEPVFRKNVNSAFIGTELEPYLREHGLDSLVIVGLTTNHCVSTSARMAANLGFETWVVADATATFDATDHEGRKFPAAEMHAVGLAGLHGEFATVVKTEEVLGAVEG